jgi:hypothetical protein
MERTWQGVLTSVVLVKAGREKSTRQIENQREADRHKEVEIGKI